MSERMQMAWEQVDDEGLPWDVRGYAIDQATGALAPCQSMWESGDSGRIYRGPRRPSNWPMEPISHEDVVGIIEICRERDLTFLDAAVERFGEDAFPANWLKAARKSPGMRYEGVPNENRHDAPKPKPAAEAPKKRGPGRPRKHPKPEEAKAGA